MILDKNKNKIKPYYSNYKPCNIYKGKEKIAGYKTTTVNSNNATFSNTYNDFVEIGVNGKAEQKQYEGYNLYDKSKAYLSGHDIRLKAKLTVGKTYTFSTAPYTYAQFENYRADGTQINKGNNNPQGIPTTKQTFTVPEECDNTSLIFYSGVSNPKIEDIDFTKIVLCEGATEKPYEPYCGGIPSPNLDYPQEIKTVDKVSVKVSSKNLIKDSLNYGVGNPNYTKIWDFSGGAQYDTDITYNGMKVVNITKNWNRRMQYVYLKNETVYTLSAYVKSNDKAREDDYINFPSKINDFGHSDTGSKCTIINKNFKPNSIVPDEWTRISVTFKTGTADVFTDKSTIRFEPFTLDYQNHEPNIYMCGLQLEEGDTMTDYEADFQTTETGLLNNEVLVSLPNGVKDEIRENKLIKRVGKILINENAMPKMYYEMVGDYFAIGYNIPDIKVKNVVRKLANNFMSDKLNSKSIKWDWGINEENWYLANNKLIFKVPKTTIESQKGVNDKEKITNYLKANPIVFYAELEVPQEIAIDKIKSLPLTTKVDIKANLNTEIMIKCKEME